MSSWDKSIYALWSKMQKMGKKWAKNSLNVPFVKLVSKFLFQYFLGIFMPSCFRPSIKGKMAGLQLFFAWKWLKLQMIENSLWNMRCLRFWKIDGAHHHFIKNWSISHKWPYLMNKNQNLYPHESRITLPSLLWDTLVHQVQWPGNVYFIHFLLLVLWRTVFWTNIGMDKLYF